MAGDSEKLPLSCQPDLMRGIGHKEQPFLLDQDPFERFCPPYTAAQAQELFFYHQGIAQKYRLSDPYFSFILEQTPLPTVPPEIFLEEILSGDLRVRGGLVGNFSGPELAVVIHEQTRSYLNQSTMGKSFPKDDLGQLEQLIALMISGFDPQTIIVVAENTTQQEVYSPIATIRASIGQGDRAVAEEIGNPNSNLPTLQALEFNLEQTEPALVTFFKGTRSRQTVCIGRWAVFPQIASSLAPTNTISPAFLVADCLGRVFEQYNNKVTATDQLLIAIADLHDPRLLLTINKYKPQVLVSAGAAIPTQLVSETPLKHHYGSSPDSLEKVVGYQKQIYIVLFAISDYINGCQS